MLETFFKKEAHKDVFNFLEEYFKTISQEKTPVLIIDELQAIGDLKIDEYLIYKLFNFFVRLTKELHLCHVFALSSDSLFIEKVHSDAMLQGRCQYLLVDDFDKETVKRFLKKYKFSVEEQESALNYAGGKPSHLVDLIEAKANNKINSVAGYLPLPAFFQIETMFTKFTLSSSRNSGWNFQSNKEKHVKAYHDGNWLETNAAE